MNRWVLLVALGAAACGSGDARDCDVGMSVPCTCAGGAEGTRGCDDDGSFGVCVCDLPDAGIAIDAPTAPVACDPLAPAGNQGCTGGQKCTWVTTQDDPAEGTVACVPDGLVATGGACAFGAPGPITGYDECVAGDVCISGTCKHACDLETAQGCDAGQRCAPYAGVFFDDAGAPTYGACESSCDPVTQQLSGGGMCPAGQGCYLLTSSETTVAICAPAGTLTHGQQIVGTAFANSCAPGHQARRRAGTTLFECGALCQIAEVTSSLNLASEGGVAPYTCASRGAAAPDNATDGESCRYWWAREPFEDRSPYSNTVGWCFEHAAQTYDTNGDMTPDAPFPRCPTVTHGDVIPPIGAPPHDDAQYFWCAPLVTMFTRGGTHPRGDVRMPDRFVDIASKER